MWCDVMWCDVMWCDVMWCDVMWCDVMWCDVMIHAVKSACLGGRIDVDGCGTMQTRQHGHHHGNACMCHGCDQQWSIMNKHTHHNDNNITSNNNICKWMFLWQFNLQDPSGAHPMHTCTWHPMHTCTWHPMHTCTSLTHRGHHHKCMKVPFMLNNKSWKIENKNHHNQQQHNNTTIQQHPAPGWSTTATCHVYICSMCQRLMPLARHSPPQAAMSTKEINLFSIVRT